MSNRCPGRIGPGSGALGVEQQSPDLHGWVRKPSGSTSCPGRLRPSSKKSCGVDQLSQAIPAQLGGPAVSTSSSGPLVLWSEGPRGRPAVQGDSGPGPKAGGVNQLSLAPRVLFRGLGVNQLSLATGARVQRPLVSTICPWRFALKSVDPRGRTTVPGDRGPVPVPAGSTRCPGQLGPGPRSRSCDQLSRATRVRGRGPVVSTSCPA